MIGRVAAHIVDPRAKEVLVRGESEIDPRQLDLIAIKGIPSIRGAVHR
jgi:hypothetical protein